MMVSAAEVKSALGSFADPATTVSLDTGSDHARIRLTREGANREYFWDVHSGAIEARHSGLRFATVDSLLASPEFADLRSMASTQQRTLRQLIDEPFLRPAIVLDTDVSDFDTLKRELSRPEPDRIRVVLIDGPAGVGKTRLIEKLLWREPSNTRRGARCLPCCT